MPKIDLGGWPKRGEDRELTSALRRYRSEFERLADGARRPLMTRVNPEDGSLNTLCVFLPQGPHGQAVLDLIERVVETIICQHCVGGDVELMERDYDG